MPPRFPRAILPVIAIGLIAGPVAARPGYPGWGWPDDYGFDHGDWHHRQPDATGSRREGEVEVVRFVRRDSIGLLGHGPIAVSAVASGVPGIDTQAVYEAAAVDQFVKLGYDTAQTGGAEGQRAELQVIRDVVVPAEKKRSPVSGEATVGASNHGSFMGMALNLDFTKPKGALLSTRMNARILDKATGKVLWEGHATIYSRDGDEDYSEGSIANRLAARLFSDLSSGRDVTIVD